MKTSNKMLIGIAVALLVIPFSTMVFSSLSGRVDYDEYQRGVDAESAYLDAEDRFLLTTKLDKFKDVKFSSPNSSYIHLYLVESEEYGFKTNQPYKDELAYEVEKNGTLHFSMSADAPYPTIFIYAPNVDHVEFDNVRLGALNTEQDSLGLILNNYRHRQETMIAENPNLTFLHLTLNNADWTMRGSSPMFAQLKSIEIELNNSSMSLTSDYYNHILVEAKNSSFQINPAKGEDTTVGNLTVNTIGKSTISLEERVQIDSLSGTISDSTLVKMPYYLMGGLTNSK